MRIQGCAIASVTAILFLIVPTLQKKAHHNKPLKHGQLERIQEPEDLAQAERNKDAHNYLNSHSEQEECHKAALHKCGQIFLRAHKLLTYLEDDLLAYRTRCGVRTAFFECLRTTKEKICSRQYKHFFKVETGFRKKLTEALWATRVCLLGVKSIENL